MFKEGKVFYETVKVDRESKNPRRSPVSEFYLNTEKLEDGEIDQDEHIRKVSALMKLFKDPDSYDDQMFPAFSKRKRELHETEKGVEEMSKEFQQFVDEEVKKAEERAEQRAKQWAEQMAEQRADESTIAHIRSLTEKKHFTVQEAMDALSIPADKQDVYAQMV